MAGVIAIAAMVAMGLTAPNAWAQTGPVEGTTAGFGYDLVMGSGTGGMVQGFTVLVDHPIWGYVTVAGGGSYVTGSGTMHGIMSEAQRTYAGAGPGFRLPLGEDGGTEFFGHALFGMLHQNIMSTNALASVTRKETGVNGRFGVGLDYAPGDGMAFRIAIDYDGEAHLVGGLAFRF